MSKDCMDRYLGLDLWFSDIALKAVIDRHGGREMHRARLSARPIDNEEAYALASAGAPVGSIVSIEDVSIEDSGLILNQAT
jgi:hypothetical protein